MLAAARAPTPQLLAVVRRAPELAIYAELLELAISTAASGQPTVVRCNAEERLAHGEPALHGATLRLSKRPTEKLYSQLRDHARAHGIPAQPALPLLQQAAQLNSPAGPSGVVHELTLLPALQAARQACTQAVLGSAWREGICPVCGSWPTLAEMRGLERYRVLRCGRCGAEWQFPWQLCPFCANDDHASLSRLYSDHTGEARRIFACERCHGYVKTIATLAAMAPLTVLVEDLATLNFDLAALDAGYGRPGQPGFNLAVEVRWSE